MAEPETSPSPQGPFTREQMRADIARALRMAPGDFTDDEDLADLGLDSLRAIDLVTRWGDRGLALDFGELAETLSVEAWWGVAERAIARRAHG